MPKTTPSADRLLEVIERMGRTRVLLVADLVLDRFIIGRPSRISREAPVLILQQDREIYTAGGGANAAVAAATLGAQVAVAGAVGRDAEGSKLLEALTEAGIDASAVNRLDDYRTPTKSRVVGRGVHAMPQQIVRFDREDRLPADFEPAIPASEPQIVLVSDYGYGAAAPSALDRVRELETPILVDSRYRLTEFGGVTGATPNQEEAERILRASIEDRPAQAADEVRTKLAVEHLLLTRGSEGMVLATDTGQTHIPVHGSGEVADVTGAGDTVLATFGTALAAGADPLEAALLANYAGGIVVTKAGTATVNQNQLAAAVQQDPEPIRRLERSRA